jgi:hypothetical protein
VLVRGWLWISVCVGIFVLQLRSAVLALPPLAPVLAVRPVPQSLHWVFSGARARSSCCVQHSLPALPLLAPVLAVARAAVLAPVLLAPVLAVARVAVLAPVLLAPVLTVARAAVSALVLLAPAVLAPPPAR